MFLPTPHTPHPTPHYPILFKQDLVLMLRWESIVDTELAYTSSL
ncbi:hypothetical protein N44_02224 [Microcystis aeruginosa NIES-44]|uniref:Uncharacterized protein n=1 Tax=Microcystis aeruginosa NIES-44 TaxID=449439 RepID=A0A0A1VUN6_MICAE|nr:hypothetical protein N44_02224 [Microcystis aeruginosa NIES-44]